jgi:hypothetical protein
MLKSTLGFLFETHHAFYLELMTHIINSMEAEVEELAYRFHHGRLADNAIPDFEEAVTIYRPLGTDQLKHNKTVPQNAADFIAAPFFAMMLVPKNDLLTEALVLIDNPAVRNTLQLEFASLANKILIAGELGPDNPDNLKSAADQATAYVNLALEELSHGEAHQAAALLKTIYLEELFRLAYTKIKTICNKLEQLMKIGWLSHWPHGLNLLDQEWYEPAVLLRSEPPMLFRQTPSGREHKEDLIRSQNDLRQVETLVRMLTQLTPLYQLVQPGKDSGWDEISQALWQKAQHQDLASVTLGSLVITAAVQTIWQGSWSITPLPRTRWPEIFPLISSGKIKAAIAARYTALFPEQADIQYAEEYMEPILKNYREEIEAMQGGPMTAPHLVTQLLFTDK